MRSGPLTLRRSSVFRIDLPPSDLAKLERDLCLFVDSASDDSVLKQLSAIDSQLKGERVTSESKDANVERAVRAIRRIRKLAQSFSRVADGDRWQHEYDVALIAQFLFSAGNRSISETKRRAALDRANTLRARLIARSPELNPKADEVWERLLEDRAWKIAYSLLRLDQLPRGGWSRSLPQWMELLWEGEHGTVIRSPAMKDDGGADTAGYAVHLLSQFAGQVFRGGLEPSDETRHALQACAMALQKRVGKHGGIDEGTTSRGKPPEKKVRHTIVGLLVHLNCKRVGVPGFEEDVDEEMVDYLLEVIPQWSEDKSHLFGMYSSAVALRRVLGEPPNDSLLGKWSSLRGCLDEHLPDMAKRLKDIMYEPEPKGTYPPEGSLVSDKIRASFFKPYYGLWRMERSNALMFLSLLFDASGSRFTCEDELPPEVKQHICTGLADLLSEVEVTSDLSEGLVRYHTSVGRTKAPRDWGLSAEFARLLEMPAIQALLQDAGVQERQLEQKRSILRRALRESLADYGKYHAVFRRTHGLSAGAYLRDEVARRISPRQLTVLDEQIRMANAEWCSEQTLHRLAQCILTSSPVTEQDDLKSESNAEAKTLTELFVSKLAAGDHRKLPGDQFSREYWTEESYNRTIAYFNQPSAKLNPATRSGIHDTLFLRPEHVCGPFEGEKLRAVDLGC